MALYDLQLGRLALMTIEGKVSEDIGLALDAQEDAAAVTGKRRARGLDLQVPVRGDPTETNPFLVGERKRRQLRSLIDNELYAPLGVYLRFNPDPDLNGWMAIGASALSWGEGGVSLSDYVWEISQAFVRGRRRSHQAATRLELYGRWLATTPDDYRNSVFVTDYAGLSGSALSMLFLPVGATAPAANWYPAGQPVTPIVRACADGNLPVVLGRAHDDTITYEQAEVDMGKGDVVVYDRRQFSPDILDDFSVDTITSGQWAFDVGAGTIAVAGGQLVPSTVADKQLYLPGRTYTDSVQQTKFTTGASVAGNTPVYHRLKRLDAQNYLYAGMFVRGATSILEIGVVNNGVAVDQVGTGSIALAANTTYWIRTWMQGNVITVEYYTADPASNAPPLSPLTFTLTGANVTKFGAGVAGGHGLRINSLPGVDWRFDDYQGAVLLDPSTDPQASYGWEEMYGPQWPLSSDVPVLDNRLCRVRWVPAQSALAVDAWIAGQGYVEQGRLTLWDLYAGVNSYTQHTYLIGARLEEWTPEAAVVSLITQRTAADASTRMETYVTLQRGWLGPRLESYVQTLGGAGNQGGQHRWTPFDTTGWVAAFPAASWSVLPTDDALVTWASVAGPTALAEPMVGLLPKSTAATVLPVWLTGFVSGTNYPTYQDRAAYGGGVTARNSIAYATVSSYLTTILSFSAARQADLIMEGEAMTLGAGTTSTADGSASGGNTAQATRTADAIHVSRATWPNGRVGRYRVFVRVKTSASTLNVYAKTPGTTGATKTTTSATYVWVDLGEVVANNDTLEIHAWAAAAATFSVDRLIAFKVEDRTAAAPTYDGLRDAMGQHLNDHRGWLELVER